MKNPNIDKNGDFILRWKLDVPQKRRRGKDPFKDFVRDLLNELLNIVMLTCKGEDVKVDGFYFLNDKKVFKIFGKRKKPRN